MIHVRDLIAEVNYEDLLRQGKIPSMLDAVQKTISKRFPPWVYREKSFSTFGMMMDFIVRRMLIQGLPECKFTQGRESVSHLISQDPSKYAPYVEHLARYADLNIKWTDIVYDSACLASLQWSPSSHDCSSDQDDLDLTETKDNHETKEHPISLYTKEEVHKYIPALQNVAKDLVEIWKEYGVLGREVKFNEEYNLDAITSHPDIVTETAVLDIKTTGDFSKMATESFLQTLSYFAILRGLGHSVRYLGIVLPMQREIMVYDLEAWDCAPFLEVIMEVARRKNPGLVLIRREVMEAVGSHVGRTHGNKTLTMTETLQNYVQARGIRPVQMFLRPNRSGGNSSITEADLTSATEFIRGIGVPYFTHAIYTINLCTPSLPKYQADIDWNRQILAMDLQTTYRLGGKGVVVHTGTRNIRNELLLSEEEALNNMEQAVRSILPDATPECPLLLETPCGEGYEVCWTPESLADFYARFSDEEKKRLKLCCDTCHIYTSGFYPFDYVQRWAGRHGAESIALFHLNDSAKPFNSHVDRHASIGQGYIGLPELYKVMEWALDNKVPMVHE